MIPKTKDRGESSRASQRVGSVNKRRTQITDIITYVYSGEQFVTRRIMR